jgi:hypothetical protein
MESIAEVEQTLQMILEERANILARETGCIKRQRTFTGASLVQTLLFSWQQHPHASLEQMASMAQTAAVSVTDSAVHKRFSPQCVELLRRVFEEMSAVVVQAASPVEIAVLRRFEAVILEDSSTISLPSALSALWPGCGNQNTQEAASLKLHVRWELQRGRLDGPALTAGRVSDHRSPWYEAPVQAEVLYIQDIGYFNIERMRQRQAAGAFSLSRLQTGTAVFNRQAQPLDVLRIAPKQVGQMKEVPVLVGKKPQLPMRLLMLRVPHAVAQQRRERLLAEAKRHSQTVSAHTLALADWTLLISDVPRARLSLGEALVLLRERGPMELLYKLWKQDGQVDEWRTDNPWRILCEIYAKLIGLLLQHWLIVLFAWQEPQRSLVKLAQVVRDTGWTLMEAMAGFRSFSSAIALIGRRMRSGCSMNTRKGRPNSAQLLIDGLDWALSTA